VSIKKILIKKKQWSASRLKKKQWRIQQAGRRGETLDPPVCSLAAEKNGTDRYFPIGVKGGAPEPKSRLVKV
jgi:hypothetical protein